MAAVDPETETSIVAAAGVPLGPPALLAPIDGQEDPLQRLDGTMEQTSEWAQLRSILESKPSFVYKTICNVLSLEWAQAFQRVAGQLQAFKDLMAKLKKLLESEEAAKLSHLMQDIHSSNIQALQREADGIDRDVKALRSDLESGKIQNLQKLAGRVANQARRFRNKYGYLRPKLDKLRREFESICDKCADETKKSDTLIAEVKMRQEKLWRALVWVDKLVLVGGVIMAGRAGLAALRLASAKHAHATAEKVAKAQATAASLAAEQAKRAKAAAAAAAAKCCVGAKTFGPPMRCYATATGSAGAVSVAIGPLGIFSGLVLTLAGRLGHLGDEAAMEVRQRARQWVDAAVAHADVLQSAANAAQMASEKAAAQVAAANFVRAQAALDSHSISQWAVATPSLFGGPLLIALAMLGFAGRKLVKRLLEQLWAAEISQHQEMKACFQLMEQCIRVAVKNLKTVCQKNDALEKGFDMVVEVAEGLTATAEDFAKYSIPEEINDEMNKLHEQVERLCKVNGQIPQAFDEFQTSLRDIQPAALATGEGSQHVSQDAGSALTCQAQGHCDLALEDNSHIQTSSNLVLASQTHGQGDSASEDQRGALTSHGQDHPPAEDSVAVTSQTHGQGDPGLEEQDVVEGWILIKAPPLSPSFTTTSTDDCLPTHMCFLVPVEEISRLGPLLAHGPDGKKLIEVCAKGQRARLMREFSLNQGGAFRLTANHPLRVLRSGNWIQEQASTLRVGDIVRTSTGMQAIDTTGAPRMALEEVFSLDIAEGEEAYVFTSTRNSGGQLSWSGVAVLGSQREEHKSRSGSAPPKLRTDYPSLGSQQCKNQARCTNICRKFQRGKCEEGQECRFCHFPHAEESKRPARGPRDGGSSQSSHST